MKRTWWVFHRRLGLILLLPLVWWMGTGLAMVLWSLNTVRGTVHASKIKLEPVNLPDNPSYPPGLFKHARSVSFVTIENNPVAIAKRESGVEIYDLANSKSLGAVIPEGWAIKAASRDFKHKAEIEKVILYPDQEGVEMPEECGGNLPVYAVYFNHSSGMRIYVDAQTGRLRARRTTIWRFYDWAFRLHALDIVPSWAKRGLMIPITLLWFVLGITGFVMWRRLWKMGKLAEQKKLERDNQGVPPLEGDGDSPAPSQE